MIEQEIIEGNRLISNFLERQVPVNFIVQSKKGAKQIGTMYKYPHEIQDWTKVDVCFHKSWDWIMPVVKKIQKLPIADFTKKKPIMNALMDVEIEFLFKTVSTFLFWYFSECVSKEKF